MLFSMYHAHFVFCAFHMKSGVMLACGAEKPSCERASGCKDINCATQHTKTIFYASHTLYPLLHRSPQLLSAAMAESRSVQPDHCLTMATLLIPTVKINPPVVFPPPPPIPTPILSTPSSLPTPSL